MEVIRRQFVVGRVFLLQREEELSCVVDLRSGKKLRVAIVDDGGGDCDCGCG